MRVFHSFRSFAVLALVLWLAACAITPPQAPVPEKITLTPTAFEDMAGWTQDAPLAALQAFRQSCKASGSKLFGTAEDWRSVCRAAQTTPDSDDAARAYFQNNFQPYLVASAGDETGLFTGYYAPELRGSLQRGGVYQTPLYEYPDDLILVDLGAFKPELKGQHILGKVEGHKFVPYDERASIAQGALQSRAKVLVWVDDPIAAFFLEVQGSGRVRLTDGTILPVGYAGANGHGYVAIGRVLADRGDLPRPVTMPAIRAWLLAHPPQAQAAMNSNPSYVFFRPLPNDDVLGAQGVALTPERSLAVDPAFMPLGAPVWLDTVDGAGVPLQRLMIAQDTGGAIKGVVRGDVFWGAGVKAETEAGTMQSRGHYVLLLPQTVHPYDR